MAETTELPSVPSFLVRIIEDLVLSNGLSIDELYRAVLDKDSDAVSVQDLERAAGWLLEGTNKPWLTLEFGRLTNFQQLDLFGPLIASCTTVKEALALYDQYQSLLHPLFGLTAEIIGDRLCLRCPKVNRVTDSVFYAEVILGAIPVWGERLTGQRLGTYEVWFRHSEPAYVDKYHEHFQCKLLFNQPCDALWVKASVLDLPIRSSAPEYHSKIKERASAQLQSIESFSAEIKRVIRAKLPDEICVEEIAMLLSCTERTMQRKLAEEETHFKALKQEVRKEEAIRLLEETTLTVEQIAFQLGYEQRSSFSAAFQRWTGLSPAKWRR